MNLEKIEELCNATLASYKKKAADSARASDKAADSEIANGNIDKAKEWTERANKKFRGIVKATNKQFANDKKTNEEVIDEDAARENMTRVMDKIAPENRDAARKTYNQARKTLSHSAAINIMHDRHCESIEPIEELSKDTLNKLGKKRFDQAEDSYNDEERFELIRRGNKAINRDDSKVTKPVIKSEETLDENLQQSSKEGRIARGTNNNLGPAKKQMGNSVLTASIAKLLVKG